MSPYTVDDLNIQNTLERKIKQGRFRVPVEGREI